MRSTEIEQIRDILSDFEKSTSDTEKINYSLEACKLIFENTNLDEMHYKNLQIKDVIVDSVLSVDEIVKYISDFLENSLKYLDTDLKGSDFEIEIKDNLKKLQELQIKYTSATKKYQELKASQQQIEKLQKETNEIQLKIDEYEQIDLEKVQMERDTKLKKLAELERTEGDNLVSYKRHLEENKALDIQSSNLQNLSNNIKVSLLEMDRLLKQVLKK